MAVEARVMRGRDKVLVFNNRAKRQMGNREKMGETSRMREMQETY
jgi:hypothetical protein